jgi:SAM-dependent methyltransferase
MSLREAWEENAEAWLRWARTPGHDVYYEFNRSQFLELVPPAGRLTVDLGSGEGRLGRDLVALGHSVVSVDASFTLARACASHEVALPTVVADAVAVPLPTGCADLVVAFMSLQDVDDLGATVEEAARVLASDGRLCMAAVHPVNSAGHFEGERTDSEAPFVISGSYLESFRYCDRVDREGLLMTFHGVHRPLETYSSALESVGLLIESMREVTEPDPGDHWHRVPMFLHIRARGR